MDLICTKCRRGGVYVVQPEQEKVQEHQTMDDFAKGVNAPVPAIYKTTTLRCKDCDYEVTY